MSPATPASLAARVARGARLLDRAWPGWAGLLDLERLQVAAPCDEVLGQLYGHTDEATSALAGPKVADDPDAALAWAAGHGFDPGEPPVELVVLDWEDLAWRTLKAAWHTEIHERRRHHPPSVAGPLGERVGRGCGLLDQLAPGWPARVDPDRLDFGDVERDLLGQVSGHYDQGLAGLLDRLDDPAAVARGPAWAVDHGLTTGDTPAAHRYAATTPKALARAWQAELARGTSRARRHAGGGGW